jgi:hypothetical protein
MGKCTGHEMRVQFLSTNFVQKNFHSDKYLVSLRDFCEMCMNKHFGSVLYHCQILPNTEIC